MRNMSFGANNPEDRPYPPGALFNGMDLNDKLYEDRYEVFVNGEFIGHKTLKNDSDKLEDINDFLKSNGFTEFLTNLDGDHYEINSNDDDIRDTLQVYLNNR